MLAMINHCLLSKRITATSAAKTSDMSLSVVSFSIKASAVSFIIKASAVSFSIKASRLLF